ncbi:beta-N-acetylhexosaminidase [Muricauda sp. ANG21]|uniref:beta-N-acetylhexosaminidase n=1 Tax=Allomuricauda sp. ANG21 TaxID=3042468 RepID=UPI003456C441
MKTRIVHTIPLCTNIQYVMGVVGFLFFVIIGEGYSQSMEMELESAYPIIPTPKDIKYGDGTVSFNGFSIQSNDFTKDTGRFLQDFLEEKGVPYHTAGLAITLQRNSSLGPNDEAYNLRIDSVVTISAPSRKGAYYAIATLKQLFRKLDGKGHFPTVDIIDWPSFGIRGFMHDTGRNFQSVDQLKEQIEILANYKYNIFHWHLTDNPGWRLESRKYPQLQSDEAFSRDVGHYYSQADFKEILVFCKARNITVIPEFDIPGHTEAFRRAFGFQKMNNPEVLAILLDLFDELMSLADANEMPYIHMGTDEVRNRAEEVPQAFIETIALFIKKNNRKVITWKEGIELDNDIVTIQQLWARHSPTAGRQFIDSRANYINHLDPFAGMVRLFFQQPGRQKDGDAMALGGILCAWPDNAVSKERDILRQNPIYPSIVFYSDAIWNGRPDYDQLYWTILPEVGSDGFKAFQSLEEKVIRHRDLFFSGKEFPYVSQTRVPWQIIGPFDHNGDVSTSFPIETEIKESYVVDGHPYSWKGPYMGGTIHLKHFFGFPSITDAERGTFYATTQIYSPDVRKQDFWIGFHGWSRSGGRRGGPFPKQGSWHHTQPKIWVNGNSIAPPKWRQPDFPVKSDEVPFIDEDYFYREPTKIPLQKGWNTILLKVPFDEPSWKWMFTCVPILQTQQGVKEAKELEFRLTTKAERNDN